MFVSEKRNLAGQATSAARLPEWVEEMSGPDAKLADPRTTRFEAKVRPTPSNLLLLILPAEVLRMVRLAYRQSAVNH